MTSENQTKNQRSTKSASSISSRKIDPTPSIHSPRYEDDQKVELNNYKQEKLTAGFRAMDTHDYIEAIKQFSLVKPDTTTSLYMCACSRLEMRYHRQAEEAVVDLTKCLELATRYGPPPFNLQIWYKLGQAYHQLGKYDDALREYNEFIQRCKLSGEPGKSNLPKGYLARGLTYQSLYELDSALKDIEEANRLINEKSSTYLSHRAALHACRGDNQKAEEDLKKGLSLMSDDDSESLLQRAIAMWELSNHYGALESLRRALSVSDNRAELAEVCFQMGRNESALKNDFEALKAYEQAIAMHPYHAQAYYHLGLLQKRDKKQMKQALKTLSRAHDLAPDRADILFERADLHQELSMYEEARIDRKRALELQPLPAYTLEMLIERIRKLNKELVKHESAEIYFQLAKAFDGLLNQKKRLKGRVEHYQQAIFSYQKTIDLDKENRFLEARALLIICHIKMQAYPQAHQLHLEFQDFLAENEKLLSYWKTFLVETKNEIESNRAEPHLNETTMSQLLGIESNRRKKQIDEQQFRKDAKDKYQNQLTFYQQMRIDLSNLLVSITVLNMNPDRLISTGHPISNQINRIIDIFGRNLNSMNDIELVLSLNSPVKNQDSSMIDLDLIRMRLKGFTEVIDTIDQVDVAQLVARHLCTRYRSQLICVTRNQNDQRYSNSKDKQNSFCSCCTSSTSAENPRSSISQVGPMERLVKFAIASIICTINTETHPKLTKLQTPKKDFLATRLVLLISNAEKNSSTKGRTESTPLLVDQNEIAEMLRNTFQESQFDEQPEPIVWDLHEFYRAPGIYFYSNGDKGQIYYDNPTPFMHPEVYGYRLGTREEVDSLKIKYNNSNDS